MTATMFNYPGGAATNLALRITGTSPVVVVDATKGQVQVAWFRCNAIAGTPTLTVEIYDGTTSFYQGSGSLVYTAIAMTSKQSILFDDGYVIPTGSQLRITSSVTNQIDVVGVKTGKQRAP